MIMESGVFFKLGQGHVLFFFRYLQQENSAGIVRPPSIDICRACVRGWDRIQSVGARAV